jgi:hypothetical protein
MRDCADILPSLLELNRIAATGRSPTSEAISSACEKYESAMIERSFAWVSKSGGASMPVREDPVKTHKILADPLCHWFRTWTLTVSWASLFPLLGKCSCPLPLPFFGCHCSDRQRKRSLSGDSYSLSLSLKTLLKYCKNDLCIYSFPISCRLISHLDVYCCSTLNIRSTVLID